MRRRIRAQVLQGDAAVSDHIDLEGFRPEDGGETIALDRTVVDRQGGCGSKGRGHAGRKKTPQATDRSRGAKRYRLLHIIGVLQRFSGVKNHRWRRDDSPGIFPGLRHGRKVSRIARTGQHDNRRIMLRW
jgi:hypothetical protein